MADGSEERKSACVPAFDVVRVASATNVCMKHYEGMNCFKQDFGRREGYYCGRMYEMGSKTSGMTYFTGL